MRIQSGICLSNMTSSFAKYILWKFVNLKWVLLHGITNSTKCYGNGKVYGVKIIFYLFIKCEQSP